MQELSRTRYAGPWRRSHTVLLFGVVLSLAALLAPPALGQAGADDAAPTEATTRSAAQSAVEVDGGRPLPLGEPLANPVVAGDARFSATRATAWERDGVQHLLLEGAVRFEMGAYGFSAQRAVVRIDQEPGVSPVRRLAVYLDGAEPMRDRGPVSAAAPRLLVTVATRGTVTLAADDFVRTGRPPAVGLVDEAVGRIAKYRTALRQATGPGISPPPLMDDDTRALRDARRAEIARAQLAAQVERLPTAAGDDAAAVTGAAADRDAPPRVEPVAPPADVAAAEPADDGATAAADAGAEPDATPILPTQATVYLSYDRAVGSEADNHLMLIGSVRVVYQDYQTGRDVVLKAERIVLFLRPDGESDPAIATRRQAEAGAAIGGDLSAGDIEGIYLEDNVVVTDGDFTVRAPRMYFDLERNQAVLLEAVLYTWDVKRGVPLYVRAQVLRQTSATSFEAHDALLTTSSFAEPHFAIAANRVTVGRPSDLASAEPGEIESFTASHTTLRWGGVPIFYWPHLAGTTQHVPLRSISGGYSSDDGPVLETTWDLFALAGRPRPSGVDLLARLDYRGDHGPAAGLIADYDRPGMFGELHSYLLPNDQGEDDFADRPSVDHDGDTRGFLHWQHRQDLQNGWDLSLEAAYVSDETFLEEFERTQAYDARDYETSAYLRKQRDNWSASMLAKYDFNDFIPQLTTLQTPGRLVDKMPELSHHRVGESFWDNRLTYFSESRLSRMRLVFGDDDPADRGFGQIGSMLNFGIPRDTSFADAADASGAPSDWVHRFDTRHEINAPLHAGIFNVTPYAVARFTGYAEDFEDYAGEDDQVRLWGQIGARMSTRFIAVYEGVDNRLFDVNRLRHIIEPTVDVFASASTLDSENLPVFDQDVENIDEGAGLRLGLTNTLQTQRGGPGRWRSVDWVRLRTDLVLREDDVSRFGERDSQVARFFSYRPEFSTGGDHFYSELLWLVSDTFGVVAELTHDLEDDRIAQWRVGASLQHTPRLDSFIDYEEIDALDLELLTYGFNYQLTTKYRMSFSHRLDFSDSRSRGLALALERRLPRWRLSLVGNYDEIDDETTLGIVLMPEGFDLRSPTLPLDALLQPF